MTKASDNVFPRLLISEGGSTSTPASGNVTVYAKANGLLYSKDDAGTETLMSGGGGALTDHTHAVTGSGATGGGATLAPTSLTVPGGGLIGAGSAFPGSPSDNDWFLRTDLECALYRYESTGTKWLCASLHTVPWTTRTAVGSTGVSATTASMMNGPTLGNAGDMWLEDFSADTFATATNDGSNYWTIALQKLDAANSATLVATLSTQSNTASNWVKEKVDIDAILAGASHLVFRVDVTEVGAANSVIFACALTYRHVFDV